MSAILCGKRSVFEELAASPPVSKRIRCSSSPVRFSPPRPLSPFYSASASQSSHLIDQLVAIFPDMDKQLLRRALEECGDDIDSAIRRLNELRLGSADPNGQSAVPADATVQPQPPANNNENDSLTVDLSALDVLAMDSAGWVELFVKEMMSASDVDDARSRTAKALAVLEKSIHAHADSEAMEQLHKENMMLKEQLEALIHENTVLKRAVALQHERHKEYEGRGKELQQLEQLVAQYKDQLRTLEVNNYALTMHLKQAQQSSSIPGRFDPDVF